MSERYAVLGAGNGGCAMAAELALLGRDVDPVDHPIVRATESGTSAARGVGSRWNAASTISPAARAPISPRCRASRQTSRAVAEAGIVIPVVPGQHHGAMIAAVLPLLRPGQLVLLNPGGVGGTLIWAEALARAGVEGVLLAQAADLSYAGFRRPGASVVIGGKKKAVSLGVFPNRDAAAVMQRLRARISRNSPWRRTPWRPGCKARACWSIRCPC